MNRRQGGDGSQIGWPGGWRLRRIGVRWRLASPVLRLAGQAAVAAAVAGAGFLLLSNLGDISETAASILVAVVVGVATVLQLRQAQRRQHTVELLATFQGTEVLAAADVWMAARITARRPVSADVGADEERYVVAMLDYYEFLCSLSLRGLVDVPLLLSQRGGTMARCLRTCQGYIADRRRNVGLELYRSFELVVDEYDRRTRRRVATTTAASAPPPAATAPPASAPPPAQPAVG